MLEVLVMELRQLEYFVAVVEEASFTRAAARVRVAQPGVSAQIRQLERELGQPLLDRSGRTVRVTEVGAAVLSYARDALGAVAGVRLAVDDLAGLVRGRVAVGVVVSCSAVDLPALLADFHRAHGGVEITLCEANSDRLIEMLRAGEIDLAWVGAAGPRAAGVTTQVIVDEPLVAAVSHQHELAGEKTISLRALSAHPLISLPRGTGLRSALDRACAAQGLRPRIAFEASNPEMLVQLAGRGLGVALLPASVAHAAVRTLHPLSLSPRVRSRLELAWRLDGPSSPAARALLLHARAALARGAASRPAAPAARRPRRTKG